MHLIDAAMLPAPGAPPLLRPRRGPRAEEIALMRSLSAGPRAVTSGPIGRCVKRDWCRAVVVEPAEGFGRTQVLFALTEAGRALIA